MCRAREFGRSNCDKSCDFAIHVFAAKMSSKLMRKYRENSGRFQIFRDVGKPIARGTFPDNNELVELAAGQVV
jgi:hypothetical protein